MNKEILVILSSLFDEKLKPINDRLLKVEENQSNYKNVSIKDLTFNVRNSPIF